MAFWRRKKKKNKEKRKGLPAPRTRVTSALALLVILLFFAVWLLTFNPLKPPIPGTLTVRPTIPTTPTVHPINTSTFNTPVGDDGPPTIWVGGGGAGNQPQCTGANNVAMAVAQGHALNSWSLTGGLYVDGSVYVKQYGTQPFQMISGNVEVRMPSFGPSGAAANPFQFVFQTTGTGYFGPTLREARGFPNWAYMKLGNSATTTFFDASAFMPDSTYQDPTSHLHPSGIGGPYFQFYRKYVSVLGGVSSANFFHYVNEMNGNANDQEITREINAGKTGIFYVDGDLGDSSNPSRGTPAGVTVIAAGKVYMESAHFGTAGPLAFNISVLAGYNPGNVTNASNPATYQKCANYAADAVLTELPGTATSTWDGIVYVPYGQAALVNDISGTLITYSLNVGWNTTAP
jgi:hypothetical protein